MKPVKLSFQNNLGELWENNNAIKRSILILLQ